jgi:hypothetical protein
MTSAPSPPTPALIKTLADFARAESGKGASEPLSLGDVLDAIARLDKRRGTRGRPAPQFRRPYCVGPLTRGARHASLHSRSNRRKAAR